MKRKTARPQKLLKTPTSITLTDPARDWLRQQSDRRGGLSVSAIVAEIIADAMRRDRAAA